MGSDNEKVIRRKIADLKQRWPAHSIPASIQEQLDAPEEALRQELDNMGDSEVDPESSIQTLPIRVIGQVENEFDEPVAADDIRSGESRIMIDSSLLAGLQGLELGQQIMVVFYFHLSKGFDPLQHPRGDRSRSRQGVFSLRSPNRPSPIGVSVVDLVGIEGNVLRVRGLDALNRTPVLDLKPA
jgi:tRNA-Thr(GGU) m(6)t(6)A37 methyltransferase TsaA